MADLVEEFESLSILYLASVERISIDPLKRIAMTFVTGKQFDLQFNKVLDFKIDIPLLRGCHVTDRSAFRESEFLTSLLDRGQSFSQKVDLNKLRHFRLTFDSGRLDVLAEDFSFMMVWEL